ncbi:hypothetical protein Pla144_20020 [Bythopirellula polymerisocia]|uniref:Uncharacterized protein n=1 Tax=Bythopirellula polymerisocia TaxID=2528003 RepID=A0A5C6CVV0_9BACT|nr:hypothetical protein Pla144_20020 [Bythopirellula polymerisocia]
MSEVGQAFIDRELIERLYDGLLELVDTPCCRLTQEGFKFCQGQLNGIQLWAIGREVDDPGTCLLDGFSDAGFLVAGEVVQNNGIFLAKCWH